MTTDSIYQRIHDILLAEKGEDMVLSPDLSVSERIAEDSVEVMEFVIALEDEFEIDISDEDIEIFQTLADVVAYIEKNKRSLIADVFCPFQEIFS